MTHLNLPVDELLSTTRAVRKRLDLNRPVEISLVKECLELALQAPSGSNSQNWHFLVLTDYNKKLQNCSVVPSILATIRRNARSGA